MKSIRSPLASANSLSSQRRQYHEQPHQAGGAGRQRAGHTKLFEALAQAGAHEAYDVVLVGRDAERLEMVAAVSRDLLSTFQASISA